MIVLDTSSLVRFFTNDIPSKAIQIKELIESNQKLYIPDVVFTELEYVLIGKTYAVTREKIITAFEYLVSKNTITTSPEIVSALDVYRTTKLDFSDCIIAANATKKGNTLCSFDKKLLSVTGMEKFTPEESKA